MYEAIILSTHGPIATVRLNRPDKLNAFGGTMREEILDALRTIGTDETVRVLIVTGEGRAFSAGGDIDQLTQLRSTGDETSFQHALATGQNITRTLRALPQPVIAAVNGACAGAGLSFAVACDIRIASEAASFGASFARIGLHPDWGASFLLPRLVGVANACELIFTGSMIRAEAAERMGLVNKVVAVNELMPTVLLLAETISSSAPRVLRLAKQSIYKSLSSDAEAAFVRENTVQSECFQSEDFLEGLTAFKEKRKPVFRGS